MFNKIVVAKIMAKLVISFLAPVSLTRSQLQCEFKIPTMFNFTDNLVVDITRLRFGDITPH
jgi:hypothetical protein